LQEAQQLKPEASFDLLDCQAPQNLPTPVANKELANLKVKNQTLTRGKSAVKINKLKEMRKVAAYEME
jgi:hypothetical protein